MNVPTNSQRLFFALWPDDRTRKAIASVVKQACQQHKGKPISTGNLHLTLAFLGNVNPNQRECLEVLAESVSMTPLSLCLEHLGVFPRPRVLWLGVKEQPDALMQLAAKLSDGARDCGIKLDNKGFNPHVSLMRKVSTLSEFAIQPIHWKANQFCLVHSISQPEGVEYRVVKSW